MLYKNNQRCNMVEFLWDPVDDNALAPDIEIDIDLDICASELDCPRIWALWKNI